MKTIAHWLSRHNWGCVALGLLALLLLPTAARAANNTCYCHPKDPWNFCREDWVVYANVTGFQNVVCNGTPPGTGGLVFSAPHPCPELAAAIAGWELPYWPSGHTENPNSYTRGGPGLPPIQSTFTLAPGPFGFACIQLPEPFFGPEFINLWPNNVPPKIALQKILRDNMAFLRDLHKRLENVPPFGRDWRGIKDMIASVINSTASLVMAMRDPINLNYAQAVPAPVLPPSVPLVAGDSLTAAQANAINAWALAMRVVNGHLQHFNKTVDALAGALEAAPTVPAARTWAVTHAQQIDALGDLIAAAGTVELSKRPAIIAAYPALAVPATCVTSLQLGDDAVDAVELGVDLYELGQFHEYARDNPCPPASTFPASLLIDLPSWQTAYAGFGALQHTAVVCAQKGYCAAAPLATITPATIAFGTWPLGALSPIDLFTVSNSGTTSLVIGSASLVGVDAAQFVKTGPKDLCSGKTLAPAGTCTIGVKFQPTTVGAKNATLQIPSNAPTVSAIVAGTGSANVGVSPASIAFGALPVGTLSTIRFATVTNTGTVTMTMGAIGISGASANQFIKTNPKDLCSGKTLIPGATCTLGIKFLPTSLGAKTAILNIAASTGAVSVILTGTGI